MADDRAHRGPPEAGGGTFPRRLLGLGARGPRLRRARTPRLEPIRRGWLAAFWHARISIRAAVPLDEFLRSRLARYLSSLPVPHTRLPLAVEIEDGQIAVRPVSPERAEAPAPGAGEAWLASLVAAEGPAVRQEAAELEIRLASLDGEIEGSRQRTADLSRKLAADVAAGALPAPASVEATAEQMGRPTVRSAGPHTAMLAFAGAAALAETWQIALPLLRSAGVDARSLAIEASRRTADVAFVAVFALGVAAALFALAHAGLEALGAAYRGDADVRRRRWLVAAGAGAGAASTVVASAIAALPFAPAGGMPRWTFVALLLAVPVAATLVLRAARSEAEARGAEIAGALAWDRDRTTALADRARRVEEISLGEAQERDLEQRRDAARRRLREINARAIEAERLARETARRERRALARVAQSLVAALELDRYEFARQASARGASDLLVPRRRPEGGRARADGSVTPAPAPTRAAG